MGISSSPITNCERDYTLMERGQEEGPEVGAVVCAHADNLTFVVDRVLLGMVEYPVGSPMVEPADPIEPRHLQLVVESYKCGTRTCASRERTENSPLLRNGNSCTISSLTTHGREL